MILKFVKLAVLLAGLCAVFAVGWLIGVRAIGNAIPPASLPAAERAFAERMRGVTMAGTFTVSGREDRAPSRDRYEIASVEKVGDDLWRFTVKMDCCGAAGQSGIPIVVPMRFVGDTPVIMMTGHSLPGLGTFTVRVLFYGDRYAGTWQHGTVGGHMTGRIEKTAAAAN
jgi:hypothetical protein